MVSACIAYAPGDLARNLKLMQIDSGLIDGNGFGIIDDARDCGASLMATEFSFVVAVG